MTADEFRNSVTVSGGTFVGSVVGAGELDNHAQVTSAGIGSGPSVEELRTLLAATRADLVAAGRNDIERAIIDDRIVHMIDALDSDEPVPEPVRSRWTRVREIVDGAAASGTAAAGAVTAIGEMVRALFGAT